MTINTTAYKTDPYVGDDATTTLPFAFRVFTESEVVVVRSDADGVEEELTLNSDYTVTLNANQNLSPGGDVELALPLATGYTVIVTSEIEAKQPTAIPNNSAFYAQLVEAGLDRLTRLVQQLTRDMTRSIKLPLSTDGDQTIPSGDRSAALIGFDADGNLDLYPTETGTSLVDLAGSSGSGLIGFIQAETGATMRTVQAKMRADAPVSPEDFGAAGDGSTDDTTPLLNALATGRHVRLTEGKTYLFTADLEITTDYQFFGGPGALKPAGNCGVVITGGCVGATVDVVVNSASHAGVAVKVDGAHRSWIRLYAVDCYDGIYVTGANVCNIDWMWGQCRHKGITWYGTTSVRSDILHIKFALFSVGAGQYGLDWDGNCHSLEIDYLGIVCGSSVSSGNGYGAVVRNTSGGTAPAIGKFNHIEVDYSGTHAIEITAGSDYDISLPYLLGATGSGIKTSAGINDYEVRVASGKSRGHTRYAIEASGGVVLLDGSMDLSSNTLGEVSGSVWTKTPRLSIDAQHYVAMASGNPLHVWDSTDYTGYDRTNNTLADFIAGAAILSRNATRVTSSVPVRLPNYTVAGLPAVSVAGDMAFATNGRKNGEGGGSGTGVLVFSDGTAWRACDTGATVAA